MNPQQQQTHLDNAVSVKVTFAKTQENRFVALASPASFAQLVDKACLAFNVVDQATRTALHVHYIDDEGDRISVSSDDELACALLLAAPGQRLLRLFVDTAATSTPVNIAPIIIAAAPVKQEDASEASIAAKTDQEEEEAEEEEQQACGAQQTTTRVAALMLKLETQAGITDIPEKRCARVLARFNGDMDKAAEVLQRCHERKQLRAAKQQKPDEESNQREARAEQRQARRNERLAARLARQQSRSHGAEEAVNVPAEVDALVAFMADKGLPTGRGKCVAALRRNGGDVEAAKAALLAWSTKQEQRRQQKAAGGTTIEDAFAAQLAKLHEMGFGDDGSGRPNAAERLRRRNLRLLAKFGGDVEQVAQHLTARKAQNQARLAERKERLSREQPVPSELVPLLAKLDEKGLGAEEGCDNAERIRKRNLRLLKKLDGDVERVASVLEARQARKQARLARRAATSAC